MAEYIGNKKYTDMNPNNRRFINGTYEEITILSDVLSEEAVPYSGIVGGYRNVITVDTDEAYRHALDVLKGIRERSGNKTQIIGNTPFRYFGRDNRTIISAEADTIKTVAERLAREGIKVSGVITGVTGKITVYKNDEAKLRAYISVVQNRDVFTKLKAMNFSSDMTDDNKIHVHNSILNTDMIYTSAEELKAAVNNENDSFIYPTSYKVALTSDAYQDDVYYISAYNPNTEEEKYMLSDSEGWTLTFLSVNDAVKYSEANNITFTNASEQLDEWRMIEEETYRKTNIDKAHAILENIDTSEEHFVFNENGTITWTYFNPDGCDGEGQFVVSTITEADIIEANKNRLAALDEDEGRDNFFNSLYSSCTTELVDADTADFVSMAEYFLNESMSEDKNIHVSHTIDVLQGNDIIDMLEQSSNILVEENAKRIERMNSVIDDNSDNIIIDGYYGVWYVIDSQIINGKELYLLSSTAYDTHGDDTPCLIVDENRNVILDNVYNGFVEYMLENNIPSYKTQKEISSELASEMWYYGFDVYVNNKKLDKYNEVADKSGIFGILEDSGNHVTAYVYDHDVYSVAAEVASTVFDISTKYYKAEKTVGNPYYLNLEQYHEDNGWENWRRAENEYANTMFALMEGNYTSVKNYLLNVIDASDNRSDMAEVREAALKALSNIDLFEIGMKEFHPNDMVERDTVRDDEAINEPDEETSYSKLLFARVNDEYVHFIEQMKKESPDVLIESAAEIADKDKIRLYLENNSPAISDEQYKALLSRPYPLDEIYEQWVKMGELSSLADVEIAIEETANRIILSYEHTRHDEKEKLTSESKDIILDGYEGTWHVVSAAEIANTKLFALESDNYGYTDEVGYIIADENGAILEDDIHSGFASFIVDNKERFVFSITQENETVYYRNDEMTVDRLKNECVFADRPLLYGRDHGERISEIAFAEISQSDNALAVEINVDNREMIVYGGEDTMLRFSFDDIRAYLEETGRGIITTDTIGAALDLDNSHLTFSVVSIDDGDDFVIGGYVDEENITSTEQFKEYIENSDTDIENVSVRVDHYIIGNTNEESIDMSSEQAEYVQEHLDEVLERATVLETSTFNVSTQEEAELEEAEPTIMPLYLKDFNEAIAAGERSTFIANLNENRACAKAIDKALSDNYSNNILNSRAALESVLQNYSFERVVHVVAARLYHNDWDRRITDDNTNWAKSIFSELSSDAQQMAQQYQLNAHPGLINLFADTVRQAERTRNVQHDIDEQKKETTGTYSIYQIPSGERYRDIRFTSYAHLEIMGQLPDSFNYEKVYSGSLDDIPGNNKLEDIYRIFNTNHPEDFTGHSLSISDVVVIENENGKTAYYVDDIGYKDITDVFLNLNRTEPQEEAELADTEPVMTVGVIEKYGLEIDFKDIDRIILQTEDIRYEGGIDSDGHERKDNFSHSTHEVTISFSESKNSLILGDDSEEGILSGRDNSQITIDEALTVIQNFLDESQTDNDKSMYIKYDDGRTQYINPVKLLEAARAEQETEPERKKSGSEIQVGDKFLYNDREYTVTSDKGIYPDDVGISYTEQSGSMTYIATQNISREKLASQGIYLGNSEEIQSPVGNEQSSKVKAEDLSVGDKILVNGETWTVLSTGKFLASFENEKGENKNIYKTLDSSWQEELDSLGFDFVSKAEEIHSPVGTRQSYTPEKNDILEYGDKVYIIESVKGDTVTLQDTGSLIPDNLTVSVSDIMSDERYVVLEKGKQEDVPQNTDEMSVAQELIFDYWEREFDTPKPNSPISDLHSVGLAYTELGDNAEHTFEVTVDLVDFSVNYYIDNEKIRSDTYDTLSELIEQELSHLDFDYYVAEGNSELEKLGEISPEVSENNQVDTAPEETVQGEQEKNNYVITDDNYGDFGGAKTRYKNNIAAIKLLKSIEAENRMATPEEQNVLAKYVGWGGLASAFDATKTDWQNEYAELRSILTDDEYMAARASTLNAHYTSPDVINAIYTALSNMGFEGGKILEPAMGTGNFFGAMPENMREKSSLSGVELDSISGRIAKQLYQSADIVISGYEDTKFNDSSYDVAVGNVPFGDYKLYDKDYNKYNFNIHDYFFAKSLDKVHPGGIIAFVTSQGTMDKKNSEVRKYLAERAELLGAIRLPNNAFKTNAGTEVTSDIIFLQKRERPIAIDENSTPWIGRSYINDGIAVNNYFAEHPEMILGRMVQGNKMYGNQSESTMCVPIEGAVLKEQLAEAVKNISGEYKTAKRSVSKNVSAEEIPAPPDVRYYSYAVVNDNLYFRDNGNTMKKVDGKKETVDRCKLMVDLRKTVTELLDMQVNNIKGDFTEDITAKREELNKKYDSFVSKYGLLHDKANAKVFDNDASYHLLKSLEVVDSDNKFIGKADIFTRDTIKPKVITEKVDNAHDALILSLSEKLKVDMEFMQQISDMTEEQLIADLKGSIYQNPAKNMQWESADEYLTGNVRKKLREAEAAGMENNVEALRAVIPERIEAQDIDIKLGAAWIDPEYVRQFIIDVFQPNYKTCRELEVSYDKFSDTWGITGYNSNDYNISANETYGRFDGRFNGYKLIEMALNQKEPKINKDLIDPATGLVVRDVKGNPVKVTDTEETAVIQEKQKQLKKKFAEWVMDDPVRREKLVEKYNEIFNSVRLREYDGSHLNFVGMSSDITLNPHQKNAVARALFSGNTLLAHEVGAGKTYEMVAIAMEGKRLGLHNKALFAVPKHLTEQMGIAFRELYPNCNILVATEKDFDTKHRRDMLAKIATGDWDAVIVGHSQFDRMQMSAEKEMQYINEELDELRAALEQSNDGNKKSFTVKQIERTIKKYERDLKKIEDRKQSDSFIDFEQLGIDKLFIDESQNYKNLSVATKMRNVAGLGGEGSGKSMQLLMKCRYLDEITGNKGTVFASGTPISNSMTELYSLMRYLQSAKLDEMGLTSFDRWASVFGETKTEMELKPTANGEYQMKTRFAKFNNIPELMTMFKECADIKTAETLNLPRPECEKHVVNVPPSKAQSEFVKQLGERAELIHTGVVDNHIDNMLKITTDGRKIGLDARCIDPNAPDDPNSKVNTCINNVFDIWQKTSEKRSTQLIFCDISTPQQPQNNNMYTVMRKGVDGKYHAIYSDKLKENDTRETVFNTLVNKPPKDFIEEIGALIDRDVIVIRKVNEEEETAYHTLSVVSDSAIKDVPQDNELWNDVKISPIQTFESERRFCVYDDIKQKLIAMGVPEKEIAFIHDYEKQEDKQKLFDQMNKGEVRIMIGSTSKCGAGMNVQKKLIALHDLDAPMRPSDMGQRRGRIERQGNENAKVDIYRYTTDRTFDAYLYQMLENKQRFISQIMTEKSPVRSCDDIDEIVLDFAETKALCAGNPLIKERLDLQNDISKLNILKSNYLSHKYLLQDKLINYPKQRQSEEIRIDKLKTDIKAAHPLMEDEDGRKYAPITIAGKTYTDREESGAALRDFVQQHINAIYDGKEIEIGEYRGFKLSAFVSAMNSLDDTALKLCLTGATKHYCDMKLDSSVSPAGNITRLNNAIANIEEKELLSAVESLERLDSNYNKIKAEIDVPFQHEAELAEKEKRLTEVETQLMHSEISSNVVNGSILYDKLVAICPELESGENFCKHYEAPGLEPLTIEKYNNTCTIMHTYVQNGDLMYDPAVTFDIDVGNRTIDVTSYEQSSLGLYEEYDDGNQEKKSDCISFCETWFDNIQSQNYTERDERNQPDQNINR